MRTANGSSKQASPKDALYDRQALRTFVGLDLRADPVPDATTLLRFRHLREAHELTRRIFEAVGALLAERKLRMQEGTVIAAPIIAAPSSTKNARKERAPEMPQPKQGRPWHFGMKAHLGGEAASGLVHTVTGPAANVADSAQTPELLHGEEKAGSADAGYIGAEKRAEGSARATEIEWHVAAKRGQVKAMAGGMLKELTQACEKAKAQVRARGAPPLPIIKNLFRQRQVRYRGWAKNPAQLATLFALANLVIAKAALLNATRA